MDYIVFLERRVCVCDLENLFTCRHIAVLLVCIAANKAMALATFVQSNHRLCTHPASQVLHLQCNRTWGIPLYPSYYTAEETTGFYSLEKSCYAI